MRYLLGFLFFFSPTLHSFSQSINVYFPEILYDFGYIKESEGKVLHSFYFTNNEKEALEIKEVAASCGCMLPRASGKILGPGEKGFVQVEYDPEGRPGKFIKSLEITFISPSKGEQKFFMNIKGVVIEKEILPAYTEEWKSTFLQIKPFSAAVVSGSDFRFMNDAKLQNFVNDLTYEIDRSGFATVKLELLMPGPEHSLEMSEALFLPVKKFIITELNRRNYSSNQVGFSDHPFVKYYKVPLTALAIIKISSFDHNNDSIPESGFFQIKDDPSAAFLLKEKQNAKRDSIAAQAWKKRVYVYQGKSTKINISDPDFESFMEPVIRQVLVSGYAQIAIRVESFVAEKNKEKEWNILQKEITALQKQVLEFCEESGISPRKIGFSIPNVTVQSTTENIQRKVTLMQLQQLSVEDQFDPFELLLSRNDTVRRRNPIGEKGMRFRPPLQDLPTFQEYLGFGKSMVDTGKIEFKLWLRVMREELAKGKNIRFLIESSASNSPTFDKYDNHFVARRRARELQTMLSAVFISENIPAHKIRFDESIALVQGPKYDSRSFGISLYDRFQYLKVIPIYDTLIDTKSELFPYQVNFNYNYFELPVRSEIFQVFVNRMIPEIDKKGYIRIIIESSSSRIPSENYSNNNSLSFFRAENAKNKLRDEVRKRGYDPKRVIIVEERTLVQGPPFKAGDNASGMMFERFQYIKIIPESLIRK